MKNTIFSLLVVFLSINSWSFSQEKKIEKYYNTAKWQKCYDKSNDFLKKDSKSNYAMLHKAISLTELYKNPDYKKKNKNAIEQSLDLIKRIKKNNQDGDFMKTFTSRVNHLIKNCLNEAIALNTGNTKTKSQKIFETLTDLFDDHYVKLIYAKTKISDNDYSGKTELLNVLSRIKDENITYLNDIKINAEFYLELSEFVEKTSFFSMNVEILEFGILTVGCNDLLINRLSQICENEIQSTRLQTHIANKINITGKVYKQCKNNHLFELKWNLIESLLQKQQTNEDIQKFSTILYQEIDFLDKKDSNFLYACKLLTKEINKKSIFEMQFVDILVYIFLQREQIEFDEKLYSDAILPYMNQNQIIINDNLTKLFTGIMKQYGSYCKDIDNLIKAKQFSKAGGIIYNALQKYPNDKKLMELKQHWVIEDYKQSYIPSEVGWREFSWTGNTEDCKAGTTPKIVLQKCLDRLNYIRRFAGTPDYSIFDDELNQKCQSAALIMCANYTLTHHPDQKMLCYSDEGAKAAASSNLSLGHHSTSAIMGQLEDYGSNNQDVGHRRWILNPYTKVFGIGNSECSMALWVFGKMGSSYPDSITKQYRSRFISWPPADYVPIKFIFPRWSFSLSSADFKNATVEMFNNQQIVNLEIVSRKSGYGQNTIVWEPKINPQVGDIYKVVVKNVRFSNAVLQAADNKFEYNVIVVQTPNK